MRGGEQVLDRLASLCGPTELYTLVHDTTPHTPAIDACRIVTSSLQALPGARGCARRWYLPLMPRAVSQVQVAPCDLLISTSSAVMKSIRPPAGVPHVCYCHSPARYIWEQGADYGHGARGRLRSFGLSMIRRRFQRWDRRTADRVTMFIANSTHTAQRIRRCYGRDATVIHPPVRTAYFTPDPTVDRASHHLVVSALEPYKRVDLAIEAARRDGWPLRIVGDGSQRRTLERTAPSHVTFTGRIDDAALRDEYRAARALLFPQVEDFGIIAVEAMATGCPVVAMRGGGALDTVTNETGVFFDEQRASALAEAVATLDGHAFETHAIRAHAETFSVERFDQTMRDVIDAMRSAGG